VSGLADVRRYDGAVVARGRRDKLVPLAVQPRDLQVIDAVRRHKFLTAPQLLELWWPGGTPQVGRRRLKRLFLAGYLDRFRPLARRGSFPWTYQLGREGHRMLQAAGLVERGKRFEVREVYDYRYVLHELHLNAWVLAWRRMLGDRLLAWEGETQIDPPPGVRKAPHIPSDEDIVLQGLKDTHAKSLRPDDLLELETSSGGCRPFLIEYDRTRRVDKNFEKFRRYDTFLCWWRQETNFADRALPYVLFVCQDDEHLDLFLDAADRELTGCRWSLARDDYLGRERLLFADEAAMHRQEAVVYRVPAYPPDHPAREEGENATVRGANLPSAPRRAARVATEPTGVRLDQWAWSSLGSSL